LLTGGGSTGLEASIVVPVHNEAELVEGNTRVLVEYLDGALDGYEVMLVENGSLDDTPSRARGLAGSLGGVRALQVPEQSLGEALRLGVSEARYDKVVYFPIDLSADLSFIPESVALLDEFDVVVGSKWLGSSLDMRPLHRRLLSRGYHGLVRLLFETEFTDTTCVKAYRRSGVLPLFSEVPSSSQVFETELMLAAQRMGLSIREVPVMVRGDRPSRQPLAAKVRFKLRDLLSLRVDALAFGFGGLSIAAGLALLVYLSLEKVRSGGQGFLNPYSFLISILLVVSGFQVVAFGLLANLLLQIRRTIEVNSSDRRDEGRKEG